jgi:hypothetical protein
MILKLFIWILNLLILFAKILQISPGTGNPIEIKTD